MARIIATALGAMAMLFVGIQALSYRLDTVSNLGLSGANQEALDLTREVSTDATLITGNALPLMFIAVLAALLAGALFLAR